MDGDASPRAEEPPAADEDDREALFPLIEEQIITQISPTLRLSEFEIQSRLLAGEKLWQVAHEFGFTLAETEELLLDAYNEALQQVSRQWGIDETSLFRAERFLQQELAMQLDG